MVLTLHSRPALNLFYDEPDNDRWLPLDRFPRRLIRRLTRGARVGGQRRVFLNLRAGLDRLQIPYRVNDYRRARRNPAALACIVGKPCVLEKMNWKNPILFGAAVYSHPSDDPELLDRLAVRKILVPGKWMETMCKPFWGNAVSAWPVGIDTDLWRPTGKTKQIDVLLYDKVRWEHDRFESKLIQPIRSVLRRTGRSFIELRYGSYQEFDFLKALERCRTMVFLCEHETQGIAYQQALSSGVPIAAWDRGGVWQDPSYYPKVVFSPVTSVPYWDARCGQRFSDAADFESLWPMFWENALRGEFKPRDYVLENLTLKKCARDYVEIVKSVSE